MFKKLVYLITISCCLLLAGQVRAQDSAACGLTKAYMLAHAVSGSSLPEGLISPKAYHSGSMDTCGKIIMYYEDAEIALTGPDQGFAELAGIGTTRRNTMCAVLHYIQSVFDFSKIPTGEFLKINVSRSFTSSYPARSFGPGTGHGRSCPYFDSTHNVNGFFFDFVNSGVDPVTTDSGFHGEMKINFDSINVAFFELYSSGKTRGGGYFKFDMNNDLSVPQNCDIDLYTVGLHYMGHIMGFIDWSDKGNHILKDTSFISTLRASLYVGPNPDTSYNPIDPAVLSPVPTIGYPPPGRYWVNNKTTPVNYPLDYSNSFTHLSAHGSSYAGWARISPGDIQHYVMEYAIVEGLAKRRYLKGDLETFHDNVGYDYNPTFLTDSAVMLANHVPWSTKMAYRYNIGIAKPYFTELVPADFIVTNDSGASVVIHLASDTSLRDSDGDTLSVYPGSLVNFRGCGEGNNNHDLLILSNSNRTISYAPRHNFYGRAQFGFNLWDGKEKGAFVLYTIDVAKGNNVSVTKGTNMVQNGNIEEGEEVRLKITHENVNNSAFHISDFMSGRFGFNLPDGMPYPCPSAIRNSYSECAVRPAHSYGSFDLSFPPDSPTGEVEVTGATVKTFLRNPEPFLNAGNRYLTKKHATLHYLNDTLKPCKRYRLEFDACLNWHDTSTFGNDTLFIGFTTQDSVALPSSTHLFQRFPGIPVKGLKYADWSHFKYEFTYCNDTPSTVMYFHFQRVAKTKLVDNISLIELDDTATMAVNIHDSISGKCTSRLYGDIDSMGCPMTYTWKTIDGTIVGNTRAIEVSTILIQTYTLEVSDGCGRTASDTFTITPCPCSIGAVFGAGHDSLVSGTLTAPLAPGVYHMDGDITIASSLDFTGVKMLIEPGYKITVNPNVKLTIDNSHLLVCPDTNKLWKGIDLLSGTNSGKIEVRNHSMIEDAEIAINAVNPASTGGGDIVNLNNAVFNRNLQGVHIENYTVGSGSPAYPFTVQNTVFTSREFNVTGSGYPGMWKTDGALKEYVDNGIYAPYYIDKNYTKVKSKDDRFIEAGIKLVNTGNYVSGTYYEMVIGGGADSSHANLFDNTGTGIYAERSNLGSNNNIFINMMPVAGPAVPLPGMPVRYHGCGVYANTGIMANARLQVKRHMGSNGSAYNRFFDCGTGVYASGYYESEVSDNRFSSSNTATTGYANMGIYDATGTPGRRFTILHNNISNVPYGIQVYAGSIAATDSGVISNHALSAVNPFLPGTASSTGQYMRQAIMVDGSSAPGASAKPVLTITSNEIRGAYNGIAADNVTNHRLKLLSNTMLEMAEWTPAKAQYGISVKNCFGGIVSDNHVGMASLKGTNKIRGLYAAFNTNLQVCANSTVNMDRGFDFAQVRPQAGTRWVLNSMDNSNKGFVLGSDIGHQGYTYVDYKIPPYRYEGAGNTWMGFVGLKYETFVDNSLNTNNSKLHIRTGKMPNEQPSLNYAEKSSPSYPDLYDLSGSLILKTNLTNCDGIIWPSYYRGIADAGGSGVIKALAMVVLSDSLGYDDKSSQWMAQLSLYESGLQEPSQADTFTLFHDFMHHAAGSRYQWITDVQAALDNNDSTLAESMLIALPQAAGYQVIDTDLVITDDTSGDEAVANYYAYYQAKLRYLKKASLDTSGLLSLCSKCPALHGAAVYLARSLYARVADTTIHYDDDSCNYTGSSSLYRITQARPEDVSGAQAYALYPNPNNGSFVLKQRIAVNKTVNLKVYNAVGALVYQSEAEFVNGSLNVNMNQQIHGLYLVCVGDDKEKVHCLRFTIK